jgi:hypothetical protein
MRRFVFEHFEGNRRRQLTEVIPDDGREHSYCTVQYHGTYQIVYVMSSEPLVRMGSSSVM